MAWVRSEMAFLMYKIGMSCSENFFADNEDWKLIC